MMKMVERAGRSITIVGSFLSTSEIARINKKVIKAKKKDVCAHRHTASESERYSKTFLPVKNQVLLFVPLFEGLLPPI
jgi:hypothetical protein